LHAEVLRATMALLRRPDCRRHHRHERTLP
jgi:hypothetical protein